MPKSVQKAMKYNKESLEFIWSQVNGAEFKSSPRNNLVFAYGSVVLEHQKAIATLVESQLIGSAFALLRSQVEAVFRGLWSIQIATDKQVKDIGQNDAEPFPKFHPMAKDLDKSYRADGYVTGIATQWKTLNDLAAFKAAPQRRLMLRPAFFNEFDIEVGTVGDWLKLPQLHVLVNQLSIGSHLLTPLYRGKPFFSEVTTDNEVVIIVAEMAKRGGIDRYEFERFEQVHNEEMKASHSVKGEVVH